MTRYFLMTDGREAEREVSKAEYVTAERAARFYNTQGQPDEPATHSFLAADGTTGRIEESVLDILADLAFGQERS